MRWVITWTYPVLFSIGSAGKNFGENWIQTKLLIQNEDARESVACKMITFPCLKELNLQIKPFEQLIL